MNSENQLLSITSTTKEKMEGARRATGISSSADISFSSDINDVPEPEVLERPGRRKFTDDYKLKIVHEAGHILIHGKRDVFIEEGERQDKNEQEADAFARDFLIPPEKFVIFNRNPRYISKAQVLLFAKQLDLSPAIVVGRLQHERLLPRSHMNDLRRRFQFVNESR